MVATIRIVGNTTNAAIVIPESHCLASGVGSEAADLSDVTDCIPLAADVPTVACGLVADGLLAQITSTQVLLCSLAGLPESSTVQHHDVHGTAQYS